MFCLHMVRSRPHQRTAVYVWGYAWVRSAPESSSLEPPGLCWSLSIHSRVSQMLPANWGWKYKRTKTYPTFCTTLEPNYDENKQRKRYNNVTIPCSTVIHGALHFQGSPTARHPSPAPLPSWAHLTAITSSSHVYIYSALSVSLEEVFSDVRHEDVAVFLSSSMYLLDY